MKESQISAEIELLQTDLLIEFYNTKTLKFSQFVLSGVKAEDLRYDQKDKIDCQCPILEILETPEL